MTAKMKDMAARIAIVACQVAAMMLMAYGVSAQTRKAYDLERDFGLSAMQSKLNLGNLGSVDAAKAKYQRVFARFTGLGWADARVMTLSAFDAAWWEAILQGQGGGQAITGMIASNNHIAVPAGTYWQTMPAVFSSGEYRGMGSGYSEVNNASVNTRLVLWHERWNGDPLDRNCLQAATIGVAGNYGYIESTIIQGFSLEGRQNEFLSVAFRSCGIRMSKPGEVTYTTDIYARNFRTYGIDVSGATPHHIGTVSVFDNVVAGIGCEGCWGSTVRVDMVSGDDNGAMISSTHAANGGTGGGTWDIGAIKLETCVAGEGRCWRGQAAAVFAGQFAVSIGAISYGGGSCRTDAMLVLDPKQPNGNPQSSFVSVNAAKGWGFTHAIHDLQNRKRWAWPADYAGGGFQWAATGSGLFASLPTMTMSTGACSQRIAHTTTGVPSHTTCTPYRAIADGPPRAATTTYLDQITGTTPPPAVGSWACTAWSAWSACSSGTQSRSRTCTCEPSGSTCASARPGESESQACTAPPPSTGSDINPADVSVVANSADARSIAWAQSYAAAWGITDVIVVNAGAFHDASATTANAIRSAVEARGKQFTVLAWEYPSRVGSQSITSFVTFGQRSVSALTASPLYGYSGVRPRADKGVAPSFVLVDGKYTRKDAHGTKPTGQALHVLAKDASGGGNPRGSARASQTATGVTRWDMRSTAIGSGVNACNWINQACFLSAYRPGTVPIIAAYQSMYALGDDGGAVWAKGYYGDHVTSFGGFLPGGSAPGYANSNGQTALTYHLERGASMSVGSVSEPWQGSDGALARQFVDVSVFHPLFIGGKPVGVAAWCAVKSPDRMLFAGDGLCAPYK